jgi:aminoglycoside 6'-N-acetyltransferase I
MIVRPVEKTDWQEWLRMRRLLWPSTSLAEHEDEMGAYFMRGEGLLSWVAERSDKRLIGFLEASIREVAEDCKTRNVGYVEGWYVEPDFRRTGVGRLLVSHATQWARAHGCKEMGSDCELDNELSVKAHLGLGFEETSRLIHFRKRL